MEAKCRGICVNITKLRRKGWRLDPVAYPGIFSGGVQQIQFRTERTGSGGVTPSSGVLEAAVIWYKKFHFI